MDNSLKKKQKEKSGMPFGHGGGPGGAMLQGGQKAKDFKGTIRKLVRYLRPHLLSIILVFTFAIGSTVFTIANPKILGNVTNNVVDDYINILVYDEIQKTLPEGQSLPSGTKGKDIIDRFPQEALEQLSEDRIEILRELDLSTRPTIDFDSIKGTVILLIALYLISSILSYIQGWIMSGITQKVTYKLRRQISEKINKLPLRYYDTNSYGDILSRITNDVDTVSQSLNQSLTQLVTSLTLIVGIAIMMLTISWELSIVAIMVIPLSFVFIGLVVKRSQKLFKSQQESLGEINGHVEEMYSGHNIVKVFNGESRSLEEFKNINEKLYDSSWKSQFLSGLLMPIMRFIGNLGFVGVSVLGGFLAIQGKLKIGDIQAFIQYLQQFNQPIVQLANVTNVLQSAVASAERVFEFLEEDDEVAEAKNPVVLDNVKGYVEFDNVVFGYDPEKIVIKGFTAKAEPGQRIAIVGPTGAGKTTMVNLLMRFYDVQKGSIKIDGVDIRDMRRSDLRELFGMVLQDTWLFSGSIRDNLKYGRPEATDEEMIEAAKTAHIDHVIRSLPGEYDMVLNESADNVSQGEKQLLTIARAMLENPPMLILDEATSSVDTRTEMLIQQAMDKLMEGRTSFVIAHRLSTIKNADLILVMDQGNIIEQGKHEELLAKGGFYANLYNSQFSED